MVFGWGNAHEKKREELIQRYLKGDKALIESTKRLFKEQKPFHKNATYLWEALLHNEDEFKELLFQFRDQAEVIEALDMVQKNLDELANEGRRDFLTKSAAIAGAAMLPLYSFGQVSIYENFAQKSENIDANKFPDKIIELLTPHKDDPQNNNRTYFNNLGLAYMKTGQLDKSLHYLLKAHSIDPEFAVVNFNLGVTYAKMGRFSEAQKFISLASKNYTNTAQLQSWSNYISKNMKQ